MAGVTTTEYEAIPAVDADAEPPHLGTVVMKFGGTLRRRSRQAEGVAARLVAAREAGHRVVGVLSAMGRTTDELLDLAHQISPQPHPRELDMLVSVGERISCALAAMAIHDLGHEAISLTGSQAGIVTDTVHGKAKIVEVRARRIHEALDEGTIVLVAGFQGVSTDVRGDDARPRRLRHDRGRARRRARRRPLRDLHGRARRLHGRPARRAGRAQARRGSASTRCSRWPRRARGVLATRSIEVARSHNVKLHVRSTFDDGDGTWIREEDDEMLEKALISGGRAPARGDGLPRAGRDARAALRRARRSVRERRHDRADRARDRLLGSGRGPRRGGADARLARRSRGARATTSARSASSARA